MYRTNNSAHIRCPTPPLSLVALRDGQRKRQVQPRAEVAPMARRRSDTHGRSGSLHGGSKVAQADAACLCMRPDLDTVLTRHMHTSAAVQMNPRRTPVEPSPEQLHSNSPERHNHRCSSGRRQQRRWPRQRRSVADAICVARRVPSCPLAARR